MAVEHLHRAVGNQEGKEDSTLAFYRAMIGFRTGYPALAKGSFELVQAPAASCRSSANMTG
jgi:hypothetical protein